MKIPIIAVPMTGDDLASHPAFQRSVRMLGRDGIHVFNEQDAPLLTQANPTSLLLDELRKYTL